WLEPIGDRRRLDPGTAGAFEFGDIGRGAFLEVLILQLGISALDDNVFALDPLESESEEWDFGRRKQLVTGFVSHHFGARTTLTASVRYHHDRGPNLVL